MKKVETSTIIDTSPERAVEAFLDESMLRDWWKVERALIEKRTGGVYALAWNISGTGFGYVTTGIIGNYSSTYLEIEKLIYFNPERPLLGPMTLTVSARAIGKKTEFHLCQAGYQEGPDWNWYYEAVLQAWPVVVQTLKDYLER